MFRRGIWSPSAIFQFPIGQAPRDQVGVRGGRIGSIWAEAAAKFLKSLLRCEPAATHPHTRQPYPTYSLQPPAMNRARVHWCALVGLQLPDQFPDRNQMLFVVHKFSLREKISSCDRAILGTISYTRLTCALHVRHNTEILMKSW